MKTAIYAGAFDPITKGHLDIVERASRLFDKLIVVVGLNVSKTPLFSAYERVEMIKEATAHLKNIEVDSNSKLTVEYAKEKGAQVLVRGVRAFQDFEYELQMAIMNRRLDPEIETVFLMPKNEYSFITSSLIKGVSKFKGDITEYVPENVARRLYEKFS